MMNVSSVERIELSGVPETMLWTLHNRANEARRPGSYLPDPACVRIYDAIAYDYERHFGKPHFSHPSRSRIFDDAVKPWLAAHRGGAVIELGAGLETQFQRCDDGQVHWYCVDVPEAIRVRERFLPQTDRCRYVAVSALDLSWLDAIDATSSSHGVFVSAQGLFMYFTEAQVQQLLAAVIDRFPGVTIMFDVIPPWLSKRTLKGRNQTPHYRVPPMPWSSTHDLIGPLLRSWNPRIREVRTAPLAPPTGAFATFAKLCMKVPAMRNVGPMIVTVQTA